MRARKVRIASGATTAVMRMIHPMVNGIGWCIGNAAPAASGWSLPQSSRTAWVSEEMEAEELGGLGGVERERLVLDDHKHVAGLGEGGPGHHLGADAVGDAVLALGQVSGVVRLS